MLKMFLLPFHLLCSTTVWIDLVMGPNSVLCLYWGDHGPLCLLFKDLTEEVLYQPGVPGLL